MKRNLLILTVASLAVVMVSCKKDIVERDNTYPGSYSSNGALNSYFQQAGPQLQTFTVNAATGGVFYGNQGARLVIAPNSFVYQNMQPVTGSVDLQLIEVYGKKAIICSGGFTTSNGVPIESGGEIYINAWQGNNELELNPAGGITASIPAGLTTPPPMENFTASEIGEGADFDRVDSSLVQITWDTSNVVAAQYYYNLQVYQFGWANCDVYMNSNSDLTDFTVSLPQTFNHENTMVIISFTDYNTVSTMYTFDEETNAYVSGYYKLPIGFDVTFIAISEINGQFYYTEHSTNIVEDHLISLTPQVCTEAYVDQMLTSL